MSGRIRTIKPELLEDAITASLTDSAFRVFIGMILLADDYGNLRAETKWIDGQVYWSAVPELAVEESCKELMRPYGESQAVLVTFYRVRGQAYAHINGWSKHQKVQHPGKPRVPGPAERDDRASHETLKKPRESLTPDLRPPTSDHDPEGESAREARPFPAVGSDDSERPSEVRLKSTPPPPAADRGAPPDDDSTPWRGPKHRALAEAIRSRPVFSLLDPDRVAAAIRERLMFATTPPKFEHVLHAIARCAAHVDGLGLSAERLQRKLFSYVDRAGPEDAPSSVGADQPDKPKGPGYKEFPAEPAPPMTPERRQNVARAAAIIAGVGKGPPGGLRAPPAAPTEAELRDKARADQARLAELERAAGGK